MRLEALGQISHDGATLMAGSVFEIPNVTQAERLCVLGAAKRTSKPLSAKVAPKIPTEELLKDIGRGTAKVPRS